MNSFLQNKSLIRVASIVLFLFLLGTSNFNRLYGQTVDNSITGGTNYNGTAVGAGGTNAQAFTVTTTGILSRIDLPIRLIGSAGDAVVKIHSGSGIGGSVLYTSASQNISTPNTTYQFALNLSVTAGDVLTWEFEISSGNNIQNIYSNVGSGGRGYGGGTLCPTCDFNFTTYVTAGAVVDQQNTSQANSNSIYFSPGGSIQYINLNGQSFTAGMSGTLSKIDLDIGTVYNSGGGYCVVEVYSGDGHGGSLLATSSPVLVNTSNQTYSFPLNCSVTSGQQYTWYMSSTTVGARIDNYMSNSDVYAGGHGWTRYRYIQLSSSFTDNSINNDFSFKTYIGGAAASSTDATLSNMTLSSGTLSPSFASATTTYTASVTSSTSSITVTPTRNEAHATIQVRVNGGSYSTVTSGSASSALSLNFGANTINVKVTAEDGSTVVTYTTTVTRANYTSVSDGDWFTASIWDGNAVPPTGSDVIIGSDVTFNSSVTVNNLTINSGHSLIHNNNTLTIQPGGTITNNGTFTSNFIIDFLGSATVTGSSTSSFNYVFVDAGNVNFNSSSSSITGYLRISVGASISNKPTYPNAISLIYAGNGTITIGEEWPTGNANIAGVTIESGTTLSFGSISSSRTAGNGNNDVFTLDGTLSLSSASGGDLILQHTYANFNGTFNANGRKVTISGGGNHHFGPNSNSNPITFYDLEISGVPQCGFQFPVTITHDLKLTSGVMYIGGYDFTINSGATLTGGSASSYIFHNGSGKLVRKNIGNGATLFPLGISWSSYTPLTITNGGNFDYAVRVLNTAPSGTGVVLPSKVLNREWDITPSGAATNVDLTFQYNTGDGKSGGSFSETGSMKGISYNSSTSSWSSIGTASAVGSNPYTVTFTTPNFTNSNLYSVSNFYSSDATLSSMTLSTGTLSPSFASGIISYTASVSNATSSITVTPTRTNANATIEVRVNGGSYASVTSGSASSALSLNVGSNTIDVRVTAEDGTTQKTYTTTLCRVPTVSISSTNGPLCYGEDVSFTLTGTSGATVTYNINGGSNTTTVLTGGTSTIAVTGATANQTLNLVSITDGTCSQNLSGNSIITVNALPSITYNSNSVTSLTTQYSNGSTYYKGIAFQTDVLNTINIDSFDVNLRAGAGASRTVNVYYKSGGYSGYTSSTSGWTLLGNYTVTSAGINHATRIALSSVLTLTPGNYSFFFYENNEGVGFSASAPTGTISAQNSDMKIRVGTSIYHFFDNVLFASRNFNGTFYYSKSGVVNMTLTGGGSLCAGSPGQTLTLSGSEVGVNYQLVRNDSINVGSQKAGTGSAINWTSISTAGTYTVIATNATTNCQVTLPTNTSIQYYAVPSAIISGSTVVCQNSPSPLITFTGSNGTAPYTFTYNLDGGSDLSVTTSTGNSVTIPVNTNNADTIYFKLLSVSDASPAGCPAVYDDSLFVVVKPVPTFSSTAAPVANTICEGTSTTITCTNGATTLNAAVFTTAYSNNFSSSIGNAWTFPAIIPANVPSIQTYNGGSVLGYLSNQQAKLNLTSLPSHDSITVDFDLYIHDTWDGNSTVSGPDMFRVILDNDTALNTTFSNETWNSTTQSYPNNFSASNASFTGSLTRTLPTACNFGGGSLSAKYHITKKVAHTASTLEMILEAAGLENVCNESWSIDNVTVQYRSQSSNSNVTWTNPSINNNSITVSPIVNTYYVATLNGCSDSIQIIVNPTPRAGFTINTVNQCVTNNSYNFTDTSTLAGGGAMTYAWTMTGATTTNATTQNVTGNTYTNHGNYNVRLVATSVIGNCSDSRGRVTKTINVSPRVVITQSSLNPICAGNSVRLTANQVIGGSSTVVYTPTYTENFETAITNAWSFPAITPANVPTVQSYNGQNVLGYLTNQKAVYSQTGLAAHDYVKVEFDLYLHDSWDGNSTDSIGGSLIGKDIWKMSVNGSNVINTTFSNFSYRTQAYPNNISAVNLNGTDAVSNTLPTLCNHNGGALSSVYRISKIIPHTSGSFNLELEALGLEELCNESWSIDNFNVELGVNTATPTLLSACNGLPVSGGPVVYTVNHSNNFQSSIGSAWSFPAVSPANEPTISEFNGDSVLGFLTNQQAIYTQTGLSTHEYVKVEFDLYIHDTWDGNDVSTGVDSWKMNVDGNSVINTTFSNFSYRTQAYPNNAPAVNANFTGSVNSSLPARCNLGGGAPSSKYRISKIIPHNTSTISIVLEALGLEELCNESWSIDNFQLLLGAGSAPVSSATWNGGAITGATSCFTDITPTTSTDYTVTIGACTSPITNIDVRPAPTPAFTISNASCSKTVSFTNTNIEANVTYLWNFGDGSAVYSGTTAPNHTYSAVGTYTVTLSANILGGCTQTTTRTIKIADAPTAGIAFTGGTGCGNSVQFTNTSTIPSGNTASYLWSFGETPVADTSTQESPLHSYVADGNYTVTLTVSTGTNCSSTTTVSVNAIAAITGNQSIFTASVGSSCGNMVTTTNSSTGTNNQYAWDFGDGSVSSEVAPTHYYTAGGFKTITLTILNGVGCATTSTKIVNISDNSGANGRVGVDFAITPNTSQVLLTNDFGFEPTFTNYPNNVPVVYCAGAPTWTYGDGTGSSNTIIYSKRYAAAGTYTVRIVQQTTNTGCFAEASKTVTVLPNPLLQNNPISFKDGKIASLNNEYSTGLMNVNNNNNNLTLYPNPNKGTFKFQLNSNEIINGEIKVVDLLGRDIYKANINGNTKTESIDLNSLSIAPGTYNLVILNNGNVYARKAFVIIAD